MKTTFRGALAAATLSVCALAASSAGADPVNLAEMTKGYTYFNRPGADMAAHNAAVIACVFEATKTKSVDEQVSSGNGGILGALIENALDNAYHRSSVAAGLENCMVVEGWRVVKVSDAEGQALASLSPEALAERLAPWVGAQTPEEGVVVRTFGNDAANAATTRFAVRPGHTNDGQLSLKAVTAASLKQFGATSTLTTAAVKLDPKWPKKPLKPAQLATAPAGSAIVMIQIKGLSMHNGIGMILNRMGTNPYSPASARDLAPDMLFATVGLLGAKKTGNMLVMAVPPGRWRIYGMGIMPVLNFCMGSPAFEVKAGEVVYGGSFDLGAADIGPDMSLDPAKAWLAGLPAADTVRAASYVNGTRGLCGDNIIYSYEINGAPFEPGYALGSKAADGSIVTLPVPPVITAGGQP